MKVSAIALLGMLILTAGCAQSQPLASEPPLEKMSVAHAVGKLTVPVDVRYLASAAPTLDQPMTLQLAFTPRVAGQNLKVEFPASESMSIESGGAPLTQQKANAAGVIRHNLRVTPRKAGGGEVRVLVSMDVEGGRYFGIFSIPVGN